MTCLSPLCSRSRRPGEDCSDDGRLAVSEPRLAFRLPRGPELPFRRLSGTLPGGDQKLFWSEALRGEAAQQRPGPVVRPERGLDP
ncbi:hypothetical protein E2320_022656, partial [Naja naja]